MYHIREAVMTCLKKAEDDETLIEELTSIAKQSGAEAYQIILHVLTHLDLDLQTAETSWKEIKLTLSGGIGAFSKETVDVLTLVREADNAVYMAKEQGKNRVL